MVLSILISEAPEYQTCDEDIYFSGALVKDIYDQVQNTLQQLICPFNIHGRTIQCKIKIDNYRVDRRYV